MHDMIKKVITDMTTKLEENIGLEREAAELHQVLCNEDYFIIGTHEAKQFLGVHAFDAMEVIKEWEMDTIGESHTDFTSPEQVANMFAYVIGEYALFNCETLMTKKNGQELTTEDLHHIRSELMEVTPDDIALTMQVYMEAA